MPMEMLYLGKEGWWQLYICIQSEPSIPLETVPKVQLTKNSEDMGQVPSSGCVHLPVKEEWMKQGLTMK